MATIGLHYVKACCAAASNKRVDTNSLIAGLGVSLKSSQLSNARISDRAMVKLLRSLVDATGDAFLGFATARIAPKSFEFMLQSLFYCQTIGQAISTLQTGLSLAGCQLNISVHGHDVILELEHIHDDPENFLTEYLLVFLHRVLSWLANQAIELKRAEISYYPTGYHQEFMLLFRCPVIFDRPHNGLIFEREILNVNLTRQRNEFSEIIAQFPMVVLRFPGEEKLLDRQVFRLVVNGLIEQQRFLTATDVAERLKISTATLRRQLAQELTSFAQIKAEFRKERALVLLRGDENSIEDIALALGYSEARAFSRVFKQWTGLTPSQYRDLK